MANDPTLAGFIQFATDQGATPDRIDPNSPYFGWAYDVAIAMVNPGLQSICGPIYLLAVYNLAMSNLLNFAPDGTGTNSSDTYFSSTRKSFGMTSLTAGILTSTSDEGTSASYTVPDWAKTLTFGDLQLTKDPFGRRYLAFAQEYGTAWGLSP